MVQLAGSPQAATQLGAQELRQVEGIGTAKGSAIARSLAEAADDARKQIARAKGLGHRILCIEDQEYPPLLRTIPDPPVVLYISGKIEPRDLQALAIVGSRRCSIYGREQAERFAGLLAGAGFTVISGGARGIDSAAHKGAMVHPHGRTIAVLGSGLDVPYPPENKGLFEQVGQRGAVLSEFPFGTPPNAENFPRRNRIVSGMSRGVLVIEADEKSGALITARQAIEDHARPVFALPGRVDNALSAGPHLLIREGALLIRNLEDIFEGLEPLPDSVSQSGPWMEDSGELQPPPADTARAAATPAVVDQRQALILDHMGPEPVSVDHLIEHSGLEARAILQELTFLTLKGVVKRVDGQTYVRSGYSTKPIG